MIEWPTRAAAALKLTTSAHGSRVAMSTVPVTSNTSRGAGTKAALLDAADRLLERDGLDAVTLRAVGAIADVSRQAPYRHCVDKDALLAALAVRYYEELTDAMDAEAERSDDALRRHRRDIRRLGDRASSPLQADGE
ncbi:TetR/AcrR family transcriptional regulator [Leifsonia sp. AG29]|uniref:TetR/AcrR family transcriptional regulator n=1 Tax=Leifsonia sp. AG29 TaxID=2598860 RepID=UPI003FA38D4C